MVNGIKHQSFRCSLRLQRSGGFTLIELLMAAFISMAVFLVGFVTINGTIRARGEATATLRNTEHARLFFQTLERDLAAAWPGPFNMPKGCQDATVPAGGGVVSLADPIPVAINLEDSGGKTLTYILQFYTRADIPATDPTAPERRILVRYYVNPNEHTLCRQVREDDEATPVKLEGSFAIDGAKPDTNAMFEDALQLRVLHRRWDEANKWFVPPGVGNTQDYAVDAATASACTHLEVQLIMHDRYAEQRLSVGNELDLRATRRVFTKVFPIPKMFE